jgi:hypothetical protein
MLVFLTQHLNHAITQVRGRHPNNAIRSTHSLCSNRGDSAGRNLNQSLRQNSCIRLLFPIAHANSNPSQAAKRHKLADRLRYM